MSTIISFTGACHSGKTTYMNHIKEKIEKEGRKVVILNEKIRDYFVPGQSIDEVRNDPHLYFDLQKKINNDRLSNLVYATNDTSNTVYLEDRNITDALFYLNCYVNKSALTYEECKEYVELYKILNDFLVKFNYDIVIELSPIDSSTNQDILRPKNIEVMQEYEYDNIHKLNQSFYKDKNNYKIFNVIEDGYDEIDNYILSK